MQNDYECPRCHNVFPSSNRTMHDARCTEQNPLPLNQNKMEISKEIENNVENLMPGPKIFTNDGNDDNDNNNILFNENNNNNNNGNNFLNNNVNNFNNNNNVYNINDNFFDNKNNNFNNNNNFINNNNNDNNNNFFNNNENLKDEPPLEDFPKVFTCDICKEVILEREREDHMYCHTLQNEENNRVNNSRDNIRISRINIDEQKRIEKQIEKNNRRRRINQNPNNHNQNNSLDNNNNNRNIFYDDLFGNNNLFNNNNNNFIPNSNRINNNNNNNNNNPYIRPNNPNRRNNNINNNHIRNRPNSGNNNNNGNININQRVHVTIREVGPNGEVVTRHYYNGERQNVQSDNRIRRHNNINNNNRIHNINRPHPQPNAFIPGPRLFPFHNINNRQSIGTMFQELISSYENSGSGAHATDREILNELPETNIEDVSKLDSDKKNCVICLEDFKNREKATILPCIHLFHKNCIKSWLKKNNSCPICKFKLTRENLLRQNNNFG